MTEEEDGNLQPLDLSATPQVKIQVVVQITFRVTACRVDF